MVEHTKDGVTTMPKRTPSRKKRGAKNLPPEKLYETLCDIFPEQIAAEKFEHLMGYPPIWRRKDYIKPFDITEARGAAKTHFLYIPED